MRTIALAAILAMGILGNLLPEHVVFAEKKPEEILEVEEQNRGVLQNGVYWQTFDGSSSREEIQDALDQIRDGKAKRVEITLKGEISIDGRLTVYSNTTINAKGAVITETGTNGALLVSATARDFEDIPYNKGYKTTENIKVIGGKWDGANKAGQVIHFVHSSNIVLDGLTVTNCTNTGHLISLEGVDTATVRNCTLTGHKDMLDAKEGIHLDIVHNEVTTPDLEPSEYDDLPDRNITVTGNTITNVPNGVGSHGAVDGIYHQNITISNNVIDNVKCVPIKIYNYKNVMVSGNTISNSGNGIKVYTYVKGSENGEDNKGAYYTSNPGVKGEPLPQNHDYNITLSGNRFTNTTNSVIQAQGSAERPMRNIKIEGNTIEKAGAKGIWLLGYCPNTSVKSNIISNTSASGIDARIGCNGSVLEGNTITGSKNSGICVMSSISNVTVKGNYIKNSKSHGIWIYKKAVNVKVTGNTINGAAGNGIYVSSKSSKASIQGNKIQGTVKQNGIYVYQSTSATVGNNRVAAAGKNGIYINDSSNSAKISENTVGTCKGCGILVYKSAKAILNKNTIVKASESGIRISTARTRSTITNNTIKRADDHGIFIYQAKKAEISGNKISNVKERGINIGAGSSSALVSGNEISNAGTQGISAFDATSPKITGNTIKTTGKEGIAVGQAGKSLRITGNKITDVKQRGINVWNTKKAVISENILQDISKEAILVQNTKSNTETIHMTQIDRISKKSKVISGKARKGSTYTVKVGKRKYTVKVKNGLFQTGKINGIKSGTEITVTETMKGAGKNQLITVKKVK